MSWLQLGMLSILFFLKSEVWPSIWYAPFVFECLDLMPMSSACSSQLLLLLFIWKVDLQKVGETKIFLSLAYSPCGCYSWGWARGKLGARSPGLPHLCRGPTFWPSSLPFPVMLAGSWIRNGATLNGTVMSIWDVASQEGQFNHISETTMLFFFFKVFFYLKEL